MHRPSSRFACVAIVMLIGAALADSAAAAQVSYFGIDDPRGALANSTQAFNNFVSTLGVNGTDTLESYANGATSPSLTFGASGITATTKTGFVAAIASLSVSPSKALIDSGPSKLGGTPFDDEFTFNQPITAFGLFVSNGGDGAANTVTFRLQNTKLATSTDVVVAKLPGGASFDNVFFVGVTDTNPFDRMLLVETNDFDGLVIDNITAGIVVPEPSTLMLLAAGAVALLWAGRRRR